jgi:hypothetical protein
MQPDRDEMRTLAGALAGKLSDRPMRDRARDVAAGRLPADNERYWFNRICVHVRDAQEIRIDKRTRGQVMAWLAHFGGPLRRTELAVRRLEMRLTLEEDRVITAAARKARVSRAEFTRRAALLAATKGTE